MQDKSPLHVQGVDGGNVIACGKCRGQDRLEEAEVVG